MKTLNTLLALLFVVIFFSCKKETINICNNTKAFNNGDQVAFKADTTKGGFVSKSQQTESCDNLYDVTYSNKLGRRSVYRSVPEDQLIKIK